jgi:hypothetical protein
LLEDEWCPFVYFGRTVGGEGGLLLSEVVLIGGGGVGFNRRDLEDRKHYK